MAKILPPNKMVRVVRVVAVHCESKAEVTLSISPKNPLQCNVAPYFLHMGKNTLAKGVAHCAVLATQLHLQGHPECFGLDDETAWDYTIKSVLFDVVEQPRIPHQNFHKPQKFPVVSHAEMLRDWNDWF